MSPFVQDDLSGHGRMPSVRAVRESLSTKKIQWEMDSYVDE